MDFLLQTNKFHKIVFIKQYFRKINPAEQTIRNLLCYYLSLACQKYDTIEKLDYFLSMSYDLKSSVGLSTFGNYSIITYSLSAIDPKYLTDEKYNLNFLEEAFNDLTKPVIKNNKFDKKIFNKAKEFYASNLLYESENEDKNAYDGLIDAYFSSTIRNFKSTGDIKELENITIDDLYNYYLTILNDEKISYVTGDVKGLKAINNSTLKIKNDYFFKERSNSLDYIHDEANTKQAHLFIVYDPFIFSDSKLSQALMLINNHFGSASNSKLFTEIREKLGLCYSISSSYLGASGIIIVSAIINKINEKKVISEIDNIFAHLLDDFNLEEKKEYYKMYYKDKFDYIHTIYSEFINENYFINTPTIKDDLKIVDELTLEDIKKAHSLMKKTLVYVYGGDDFE